MPTEPNATNAVRGDKRAPEEIAEERIAKWKVDNAFHDEADRERMEIRFGSRTRMLDLAGLGLKVVPQSIRSLDELDVVDLSSNVIRKLPEWICELGKIKGINLAGNLLRRLPQRFGSLRELRVLWLQNNKLDELPTSLEGLALSHLLLNGNPEFGDTWKYFGQVSWGDPPLLLRVPSRGAAAAGAQAASRRPGEGGKDNARKTARRRKTR
jgi:Leucine-rich repeat (LRR) protein